MDGSYVLFILHALAVVVLPTFAGLCEEALGLMALKDSLKENLMTSSAQTELQGVVQLDTSLNSFLSQKYWKTRLTEPISTEQNEIMQFDIGKPSLIRGIVARGCGVETDCHHVTRYRLLYSVDNIQWHFYSTSRDQGNAVFVRDNDCSSSARFDFHCPVIARYIRILPHSWRLPCNLMVELIGCSLESPGDGVKGETPNMHPTSPNSEEDNYGNSRTTVPDRDETDIITSTGAEDSISTVTFTTEHLKTSQRITDVNISTESPSETDANPPFDNQNATEKIISDSQGETDMELTSDSPITTTIKVPWGSRTTADVPPDNKSKTNIKILSDGQSNTDEKIPSNSQTSTTVELPSTSKGTPDVKTQPNSTSEHSTPKTEFTTERKPSETTASQYAQKTDDPESPDGIMTGRENDSTNKQTEHTSGYTTESSVSDTLSANLTTIKVHPNNRTTSTYLTTDGKDTSIDTLGLSSTKGIKQTSPQTTDVDNLLPPVGCVADCEGKTDGHYHSCKNCKLFVTCSNGILYDNRPCPSSLIWDDHRKQCAYASQTCELIGSLSRA